MLSTKQLYKTRQRLKQVCSNKRAETFLEIQNWFHWQLPKCSNFLLAAVPVEGFSWGSYINSNSFTAAPVTCFKHVSIFSVCCPFVCIHVYALERESTFILKFIFTKHILKPQTVKLLL